MAESSSFSIEVGGAGRAAAHVAYFHALDAYTEYWDIFHPETRGRFYFGDGGDEAGLLGLLLPRDGCPPPFRAWQAMALGHGTHEAFLQTISEPCVAQAISEVDALLSDIFAEHFGDPRETGVRDDYLDAMFAFAVDALPAADARRDRLASDDLRCATAGRHTLDGDIMWFCWAMHLEAASALALPGHRRRALGLASVAMGCAANFAWRGHRRTRPTYRADVATEQTLKAQARLHASNPSAASAEIHALFYIREWGVPG